MLPIVLPALLLSLSDVSQVPVKEVVARIDGDVVVHHE